MLTEEQNNAVNHYKGPALILAVPGAGKTTVLIHRTANLIKKYNIKPKRILSITFSRASANDMKIRFKDEFPEIKENIIFSTIHSFCFNLVREYSYIQRIKYRLIEDTRHEINKYNILKDIYFQVNNTFITEDKLETLMNLIGYVQNMMLEEKDFPKNDILNFNIIFNKYIEYKERNNYIDFDDMLTLSYSILKEDKNILTKYQNKYDFIQVDEGQDTSRIQLEIIKLIAKPNNNLFIVADDDQSIYGFRGAYPQGLFEFTKIYDDVKIFFMEQNFRSTKNIVSASNNLILNNSKRFKKDIYTNNDFLEPISIIQVDYMKDQYEYILDHIKEYDINNPAILYRNNISAIGMVDYLERNNIPFRMNDNSLKFFNHWIIWDILNFMSFAEDITNIEIYEKIYYKKKGYISKKQLNYAKTQNSHLSVFSRIKDFPGIKYFYIKNLNELEKDFKILKNISPPEAIDYIKYDLEYEEYLKEYAVKFGYNYGTLSSILNYLRMISIGTENLEELINRLRYLKRLCIDSCNNDEGIVLSTIHSSKGLEFNSVYIIDLIDGDFPSTSSIEDFELGKYDSIEEERRLFYVAMTRAKYFLTLFVVDRIENRKIEPSRFLEDLS